MRVEEGRSDRDGVGGGRTESGRDGKSRTNGVRLRGCGGFLSTGKVHVEEEERLRGLDGLDLVNLDELVREESEEFLVRHSLGAGRLAAKGEKTGSEGGPGEGGDRPGLRVAQVGEVEGEEAVRAGGGEAVAAEVDGAGDGGLRGGNIRLRVR